MLLLNELIHQWARQYLGLVAHHDLQDDCADTLYKTMKSLGQYRGPQPFEHWAHTILRNRIRSRWRRENRDLRRLVRGDLPRGEDGSETLFETLPDEQPPTESPSDREYVCRSVTEALARLNNGRYRRLLELFYAGGMSIVEIAKLYGVERGVIDVAMSRARAALFKKMKDVDVGRRPRARRNPRRSRHEQQAEGMMQQGQAAAATGTARPRGAGPS